MGYAVKWGLIAATLFSLFLFFTPIDLYNSMGLLLTGLEGLICALFVLMAVLELKTFKQVLFINQHPELHLLKTVVAPFVTVIFCMIAFSVSTSNRIDDLLKANGVIATGKIHNGLETTKKSLRRGSSTSYKLEIGFTTKDGKPVRVWETVSADIYENVHQYQEIDVKYLPENPSIFKLLLGDDNIKKFAAGITNRNLNFDDLDKIVYMPKDSICNYLNSISRKWVAQKKPGVCLFINESKEECVIKTDTNAVIYKSIGLVNNQDILTNARVEKLESISEKDVDNYRTRNTTFYTSPQYNIQYVHGFIKGGGLNSLEAYIMIKPKN